jgi:hypothetical protein
LPSPLKSDWIPLRIGPATGVRAEDETAAAIAESNWMYHEPLEVLDREGRMGNPSPVKSPAVTDCSDPSREFQKAERKTIGLRQSRGTNIKLAPAEQGRA